MGNDKRLLYLLDCQWLGCRLVLPSWRYTLDERKRTESLDRRRFKHRGEEKLKKQMVNSKKKKPNDFLFIQWCLWRGYIHSKAKFPKYFFKFLLFLDSSFLYPFLDTVKVVKGFIMFLKLLLMCFIPFGLIDENPLATWSMMSSSESPKGSRSRVFLVRSTSSLSWVICGLFVCVSSLPSSKMTSSSRTLTFSQVASSNEISSHWTSTRSVVVLSSWRRLYLKLL